MASPQNLNNPHPIDTNPRRGVMAMTLIAGTSAAALPVLAVVVLLLARNPQLDGGIDSVLAFNLAVWLTMAAGALWALVEVAQPGGSRRAWKFLLPAPILLDGGMAAELARTPPTSWPSRLASSHAGTCMTLVTLFSLPILTSLLYVLRSVALRAARFAGSAAGLLAGSTAAAIYVWHCPPQPPLALAASHGASVLIVAAIGAVLGAKFLRCPTD